MLTHCAALHRPTTVQQTQSIVAARVVADTAPWDVADWRNWCASSTRTTTGFLQRTILVHKVKKWTKKKGLKSLMCSAALSVLRGFQGRPGHNLVQGGRKLRN